MVLLEEVWSGEKYIGVVKRTCKSRMTGSSELV